MNYTEWRDELKGNLLCVSEGERRRVLDYYAEAYADRREAGFTEREIIDGFGAPYDAAQRILAENREAPYAEPQPPRRTEQRVPPPPPPPPPAYGQPQPQQSVPQQNVPAQENEKRNGAAHILICILLICLTVTAVAALFIAAVTLISVPLGLAGLGIASLCGTVKAFISGERAYALYVLGCALTEIGAGVALAVPLEKLTVLMCRGFNKFLGKVRGYIKGGARK